MSRFGSDVLPALSWDLRGSPPRSAVCTFGAGMSLTLQSCLAGAVRGLRDSRGELLLRRPAMALTGTLPLQLERHVQLWGQTLPDHRHDLATCRLPNVDLHEGARNATSGMPGCRERASCRRCRQAVASSFHPSRGSSRCAGRLERIRSVTSSTAPNASTSTSRPRARYAANTGCLLGVDALALDDHVRGVVMEAARRRAEGKAADQPVDIDAQQDRSAHSSAELGKEAVEVAHLRDRARIAVEEEAGACPMPSSRSRSIMLVISSGTYCPAAM